MPAVSKTYAHEKPFCGSLAESRAPHNRAKAEVVGGRTGYVHPANRRYRGRSTPGKKGSSKRDGPDDQPWMVQVAGAPPISAGHEMEARGNGIGAWARSSKE